MPNASARTVRACFAADETVPPRRLKGSRKSRSRTTSPSPVSVAALVTYVKAEANYALDVFDDSFGRVRRLGPGGNRFNYEQRRFPRGDFRIA